MAVALAAPARSPLRLPPPPFHKPRLCWVRSSRRSDRHASIWRGLRRFGFHDTLLPRFDLHLKHRWLAHEMKRLTRPLLPKAICNTTVSALKMGTCLSFRWTMAAIIGQTFSTAWQAYKASAGSHFSPHEILIYLWWFCWWGWAAALMLPASAEDHEFLEIRIIVGFEGQIPLQPAKCIWS